MLFVNTKGDGLVLNVWVQPGSNRNKIQSITEDAIRIKVTSPPKEGLANKACTDFLAKELGVKRSQVEIIKGHKARKKKDENNRYYTMQVRTDLERENIIIVESTLSPGFFPIFSYP